MATEREGALRAREGARSACRVAGAIALLLLPGLGACAREASSDPPLAALGVDAATITTSGISSGGYMAAQFHVAYSRSVQGAALLAAGPYGCADGSMAKALRECTSAPLDQSLLEATIARARAASEAGRIDPVAGLGDDRVWIFRARGDSVVSEGVVRGALGFYRAFVPAERIAFVDHVEAAHTFPTLASGIDCNRLGEPFVGKCGYDAAGELLRHLQGGTLTPRVADTPGLARFDQRPFKAGSSGLADTGFVYVPARCAGGAKRCRLHVAFHGCQQGVGAVGDAFVRQAGYNEWAESNDIVVLYPQAQASMKPVNPLGCWDWWGYEGESYDTRDGAQLRAIRAMVERLASAPAARRADGG